MGRFIYEVVIRPDEGGEGFCVTVPDLDGCFTQGDTLGEAIAMSASALETYVGGILFDGDAAPMPSFGHRAPKGGRVVAVSFEATADSVSDAVSPSAAAQSLGVTRGRVSQMIRDGVLESYQVDGRTRVTTRSINTRLASSPQAGRPRKTPAHA
ncbi:MAG: type II toxin-antitoxin system HicB family antitoxin [Coriobacteriales bacterium]|jgi:excisionase family DNA binding protein|nr:type II toxin-antitoxin system HicB family antitoxin [Coriobacteriales bacterium]